MWDSPDRHVIVAQAVICLLLVAAAAFGRFPGPVPALLLAGAVGAVNASFDLMRTFGSAVLAGVAATSVALAGIPFVTCSSGRFGAVFDCTGDAPTWHLTGTVVAAGLSAASLTLARTAVRQREQERLADIEGRLAAIQRELDGRGSAQPAHRPPLIPE